MINVSISIGTSIRRSINTYILGGYHIYIYTYIDLRLNMGMSIDRPCL